LKITSIPSIQYIPDASESYLKKLKIVSAVTCLFWPFGSLLLSFKLRRYSWSKNLFWLFCTYFGFTFVITGYGFDAERYAQELVSFHQAGLTVREFFQLLYITGSDYIDIVQPLITYTISLFTDNSSVLFTVFALIFGYFYSRNLWFLFDRIKGNISGNLLIFLLAYALICPIWYINAIRMWTAAHVFLYGLLPYLIDGKKKNLLWSFSSVLFHFSFLFPVLILLGYLTLKNRPVLFFVFSIITLSISELNLEFFRGLFAYLPGFMESRTSYLDPEGARGLSELRQELSWYLKFTEQALKFIGFVFAIAILPKRKILFKNRPELLNLFSFSLWMYGWSNLSRLIPSGGRFGTLADMIMMSFLVFFIAEFYKDKVFRYLNFIAIPALLIFIVVSLRVGSDTFGLYAILGNPVIASIYNDTVPLIEFVKNIF